MNFLIGLAALIAASVLVAVGFTCLWVVIGMVYRFFTYKDGPDG